MSEDYVLPDAHEIRRLRRIKRWSQAQLALEVPCAPATVVRLEKGIKPVRLSTLEAVASALDADMRNLLSERDRVKLYPTASPGGTFLDETTAQIQSLHHRLDDLLDALGIRPEQELARRVSEAVELERREGYAAPQTQEAFLRAQSISSRRRAEDMPQLYLILSGLCSLYVVKGDLRTAQKFAFLLCALAKGMRDAVLVATARVLLVSILGFYGRFGRTQRYLDRLLTSPALDIRRLEVTFADSRVAGLGYLAHAQYALGYPDQARESLRLARQRAEETAHDYTLAWLWHFGAALHQVMREPQAAGQWAEKEIAQSAAVPFKVWRAGGIIQQGWARMMLGEVESGIAQMHRGIQAWRATGSVLALPRWLTLLAEGYQQAGDPETGLAALASLPSIVIFSGTPWRPIALFRKRRAAFLSRCWVRRKSMVLPNLSTARYR